MSDKERLIAFKNRIKDLELQLQEKTDLLDQYEAIGNAADQKIAALNTIHGDKVRNLMNSIQALKKENARLVQLSKEHKRSQLIDQLNQEIRDQDIVIQTLRELINDEPKCDGAIVKALNQGPAKIKALSREELKIENKKLSSQLITLKGQLEKYKGSNLDDSQVSKASTSQSVKSNKEDEPSRLDTNDTLIRRIEELKNENEDLKLNLKAQEDIRSRYEEEIQHRGAEISELRNAKTELIILNKKYEALQRTIEETHIKQIGKDIFKLNNDLQIEEMQIINKAQGGKLQLMEKNLRVEMEGLQLKMDQAERDKEDAIADLVKVQVKFEDLTRRNNEVQRSYFLAKEEINKVKNEMKQKIEQYESSIYVLTKQLDQLNQETSDKGSELINAKLLIETLQKEKEELTEGIKELQIHLHSLGKEPDEQEQQLNKHIQELLKKHDHAIGGVTTEADRAIRQQREHYETIIKDLQRKLVFQQEKHTKEVLNVSSDVSKLLEKHEKSSIANLDDINSNISSQMSKRDGFYGGHFGIIQNQELRRLNSNVNSVLDSEEQAAQSEEYKEFNSSVSISGSLLRKEEEILKAPPKVTKKQQYQNISHVSQMDSSLGSLVSQKSNPSRQLDNLSSDISEFSLKSRPSTVRSGSNQRKQSLQNSQGSSGTNKDRKK